MIPFRQSSNIASQRGEVAWFLTIVSMLTVALGLIIGINTTTSEQALTKSSFAAAGGTYKGKPIDRTDGMFISTGGRCRVEFNTQIDPKIVDIIITAPPGKDWPAPGAQMFSLVDDGGATGIRGLTYLKNYSFSVRMDPSDPDKVTPNPNDILVTYRVPSQPARTFVIDAAKVPSWVRDTDTEVLLVFEYSKIAGKYFFTSATSRACPGPGTPTVTVPTVTVPTVTVPTVTTTVSPTPGLCYDICTASSQCGRHLDPATDVVQPMLCLETRRTGTFTTTSELGTNYFAGPQGFSIQDAGGDEYPYTSTAFVIDETGGIQSTAYIPGFSVTNSEGTWPLDETVGTPPVRKMQLSWTTSSVPSQLRGKVYDITLNLPSTYEIIGQHCQDFTGSAACAQHNAYLAANPSEATSAVFKSIAIRSGAVVNYGWKVRKKPANPTAAPTNVPTTAPTAVPTLTPTPTPVGPIPSVCPDLAGRAPASSIADALARPSSIPGWNQPQDPSRPIGPTNPARTKLTLVNINRPFHPISNTLIYKAVCDTLTPTTVPTVAPTGAPTGVPGGHAICDPSKGVECRCMPPSCTGRDCSSKRLACEKPEVTPTITPTTVPGKAQCVFNALAFVEECEQLNDRGECVTLPGSNRFNARPIPGVEFTKTDPLWRKWAPLNNKQFLNANRPDGQKPDDSQIFSFIPTTINAFNDILRTFPLFDFGRNRTEGISVSPRQKSVQEFDTLTPRQLLEPRDDIKIASTAEIARSIPASELNRYVPAEQYSNREVANVELYYDTTNYRIVPEGRNIYSCTNSIARQLQADGALNPTTDADIIKMTTGTGACDMAQFASNPKRDTIDGLTVGCGQDIVYGWTLQKCSFNFDYVFVIDTSTTMGMPDPNLAGQRKIDAAMDQVEAFIDNIEASGTDSRVALVNFNNAVHVYQDAAGTLKPDAKGIQTGLLGVSQFGEVRSKIPAFRKTVADGGLIEKGSCQRCGLDLASKILHSRTPEEMRQRTGVVIFLSDGIPNSYAGDADPALRAKYPPEASGNVEPWGWAGIYKAADDLRKDGDTTPGPEQRTISPDTNFNDTVLLITMAFGEADRSENDGQNFRAFNYTVASDRAGAVGRWAFSTDPSDNSPISIGDIFNVVQRDLNTCSLATLAFDISQKARDINKDGIINTVDLFLVYEAYKQEGEGIDEDVNGDKVVNSLDASLVLQRVGTVVTDSEELE